MPIRRFSHEAMSTFFELCVDGKDEAFCAGLSEEIFREIDRIEGLLSRFDPTSDISRINQLKPGETLVVGQDTLECLLISLWASTECSGAFDVTVGPLMELWAPFLKLRDKLQKSAKPDPDLLKQALDLVGMDRLLLNPDEHKVRLSPSALRPEQGVWVDLGAVGKGYALDKAAEILEDWEVGQALLHAGTSTVLAMGSCDLGDSEPSAERGWPVGIGGDWGQEAGIGRIHLCDESLSGSGTEVKGAHILDPRTGLPAHHHLAAWAIAPSAAVSDALSTAFMVMSTEEVEAFCRTHPDIRALVVRTRWGKPKLADFPSGSILS